MILAPVVVNRKGEQLDLFEELRAQGFVRLRIDGKVYEIDAVPKLAKNKKHTVEVVVDRLSIRPIPSSGWPSHSRRRCAMAMAAQSRWKWTTGKEHLFSAKFACPICSYSLPELEPRLFSFNNPMGACPRCDGLGTISFFDPKRVVAFPHLSLARARSRAGIDAISFISRCCKAWRSITASIWTQPFENLPRTFSR